MNTNSKKRSRPPHLSEDLSAEDVDNLRLILKKIKSVEGVGTVGDDEDNPPPGSTSSSAFDIIASKSPFSSFFGGIFFNAKHKSIEEEISERLGKIASPEIYREVVSTPTVSGEEVVYKYKIQIRYPNCIASKQLNYLGKLKDVLKVEVEHSTTSPTGELSVVLSISEDKKIKMLYNRGDIADEKEQDKFTPCKEYSEEVNTVVNQIYKSVHVLKDEVNPPLGYRTAVSGEKLGIIQMAIQAPVTLAQVKRLKTNIPVVREVMFRADEKTEKIYMILEIYFSF